MTDDTSDAGAWLDALTFRPWIPCLVDRDGGTVFANISFLKARHDAGHRRPDGDGLALSVPFHSAPTNPGEERDHV